jgi:hypothetical protein
MSSGPTNQQVIEEYKPKFVAKRGQLKKIAANVPPLGSVTKNEGRQDLNPRPVHNRQTREYNTEIMMAEHLTDPDAKLQPERFELHGGWHLRDALLWTGPKNPMAESALRASGTGLREDLEKALATNYLVVIRTVRYDRPVAIDTRRYRGGNLDLEGFVFDLRNDNPLGSFRISARPNNLVDYVYRKGEDQMQQAENFIHSTMWSNARKEAVQALSQVTGGVFNFDH